MDFQNRVRKMWRNVYFSTEWLQNCLHIKHQPRKDETNIFIKIKHCKCMGIYSNRCVFDDWWQTQPNGNPVRLPITVGDILHVQRRNEFPYLNCRGTGISADDQGHMLCPVTRWTFWQIDGLKQSGVASAISKKVTFNEALKPTPFYPNIRNSNNLFLGCWRWQRDWW
jgi:hypothetical protein